VGWISATISSPCRARLRPPEAKKAGAVFAYGNFITVLLNFLILAFIIFLMVKQVNRLRHKKEAAAPAAPPPTSEEVILLREIRDLLKK
jgi:large conductance mechanosensitive channel